MVRVAARPQAQHLVDARNYGFPLAQTFGEPYDSQRTNGILAALAALGSNGGTIAIPSGYHRITSTIDVSVKGGVSIGGHRGDGAVNPHTGTTLVWAGAEGGTMLRYNQNGRSSLENINLDGNAHAGIGFHWENQAPVTVGANYLTMRNVNIGRCTTGLKIGRAGENQSNGSECSAYDLTLTSCGDGILWQQDQAGQWHFYNLGLLSNGNGIRTGATTGNGGNFTIHSGSFGNNTVDLNLPYVSNHTLIENVVSEVSGTFLLSEGGPNTVTGVNVMLRNVNTHSNVATAIRFRAVANLIVEHCRFLGPPSGVIQLGNDIGGAAAPLRIFRDTVMLTPTFLDTGNLYHIVYEHLPKLGLGYLERLYELQDQTGTTFLKHNFDGSVETHGIVARSKAGAPTTAEVSAGQAQVWKDTSGGAVKLFFNDAGSMKSVTLS